MRHRIQVVLAAVLLASALTAPTVFAQTVTEDPAPGHLISLNPISSVFSIFNLEYERATWRRTSLALSTTYWGKGDAANDANASYISADLKGRYYPGSQLNGFSFGVVLGFSSLGGEVRTCSDPADCGKGRVNAVSTGITLDYLAPLGERELFVFGAGVGAKKLKPFTKEVDAFLTYPFLRLTLGIAL